MTEDEDWQLLMDAGAILGEGTVWSARDSRLYWIDIKAPAIHWLDPVGGECGSWRPPCRIGSIAPRAAGGFIAGCERGLALIDPHAETFELIVDPEPDRTGNRFNDGAVDPQGRFWAGTIDDAEEEATGALYRFDAAERWERIDDGYRITNGPAFSPDGGRMYHNDSALQLTYAFDLDDGEASNRHVLIRHSEGHPDGMTCDAEGCLWIAFWDGWAVRRFSPDGDQLEERRLPVSRPTRPAFGGAGLDRLFVSTASVDIDKRLEPLAGGLFEICRPGTTGIPVPEFRG